MILNAGLVRGAKPSAFDKFGAMIDHNHSTAQVCHPPRKTAGATRDVKDVIARAYGEQPLARRFNQLRLKLITVADAVIPPCCVGIPDLEVFLGELREFRLGALVIHM
jgi:hypothetical protein